MTTPLHGLSPAEIAERVGSSRRRQGLPERITDALALREMASLLSAPLRVWSGSGRGFAA